VIQSTRKKINHLNSLAYIVTRKTGMRVALSMALASDAVIEVHFGSSLGSSGK
jgi:hypothetical protein